MSFKLANYRTVTLAAQPLSYFLKWHCHLLEKLKLCFQIFHLERNFSRARERLSTKANDLLNLML